jgi:hypothetical protein
VAFRGAEDRGVSEVDDGRDDVTELLRQSVLQPLPAAPRRPPLLADLPVVVEGLRERQEPHFAVFGDSADGTGKLGSIDGVMAASM